MKYKVSAQYIPDRLTVFHEVLTDGSVENQKPDGAEIIASMKRAKVTEPGTIEWYETCYCETPLKHERETVYDKYLTNIKTELVDEFGKIEGKSFWLLMETSRNA